MTDLMAIVCNLPEQDRTQRRIEIQSLLHNHTGHSRLPEGVELEWPFTEEAARGLLDFILFERVCCTSFRYELDFPPPHSTIRLRITAPPSQVAALQSICLTGRD